MNKLEAINRLIKATKIDLNNQNTIFANPGKHKDSWWLEPANEKFKSGFYFILNNAEEKKLLLFEVPKNAVNKSEFRQREEKGVSQIIIPISDTAYKDRKGFSLNKFLINVIEY